MQRPEDHRERNDIRYRYRGPQGLDGYRTLRDELPTRVAELIDAVVPPAPPPSHAAFDADLDELQALVGAMGGRVLDMGRRIGPALETWDQDELGRIVTDDDPIDQAYGLIANRVVELIARRQPVATDLRAILAMRQTALHLERIADGFVDIAAAAGTDRPAIDDAPPEQVIAMASTVVTMIETAMSALTDRDQARARGVEQQDKALDGLHDSLFTELSTARVTGAGLDTVLALDRIGRALKRAGEHALDIAEQVLFLTTGEIVELGRP